MPRLLGKDQTDLPRGLRSTRATYGVCGQWKGISKDIIIDRIVHQAFVMADEEVLHVILVPEFCRDAVFTAMGSTWSWSKHLAERLVSAAVMEHIRPKIVHHGIVNLRYVGKLIAGVQETMVV